MAVVGIPLVIIPPFGSVLYTWKCTCVHRPNDTVGSQSPGVINLTTGLTVAITMKQANVFSHVIFSYNSLPVPRWAVISFHR